MHSQNMTLAGTVYRQATEYKITRESLGVTLINSGKILQAYQGIREVNLNLGPVEKILPTDAIERIL